MTRDPGGFDPSTVAPGTIFNETLIHDFDTVRFLNPGSEVVEVFAVADALVEPTWRERGLLDTAVVTVRFDNGAVEVAEACFEAAYGYDVRGEVLGSRGMATMGDAVRGLDPAPVGGDDAQAALAIALAANASVRAGRPVQLSEVAL